MLYFCFKGDIGAVEALAEKYFYRDDNPNIRSPEELASFHTWRTQQEMGGLRRSFMISEHLGQCVPDSADYRTFLRTYEDTLERMLEGGSLESNLEGAQEMCEKKCRLIVGRFGETVYIKTIPAIIPLDIPEFGRDLIRKGSIPIRWPTSNSPFVRFMNELWEGGWAVYDGKGNSRQDIAYAIMGDKVPEPEGLKAVERVVFTPSAHDLFEPMPSGGGGGGYCIEIPTDGLRQEHDEDGKPVGEPYDPYELGGEDPVFEPAPVVTTESRAEAQLIVTGTDEDGAPCEFADNSVAEACGVDMSRFTDDSMDGL